jgi:hypothetical protein
MLALFANLRRTRSSGYRNTMPLTQSKAVVRMALVSQTLPNRSAGDPYTYSVRVLTFWENDMLSGIDPTSWFPL